MLNQFYDNAHSIVGDIYANTASLSLSLADYPHSLDGDILAIVNTWEALLMNESSTQASVFLKPWLQIAKPRKLEG